MKKLNKHAFLTELRLMGRVETETVVVTKMMSDDNTFYLIRKNNNSIITATPEEAYKIACNNWIQPKKSFIALGKVLQKAGKKLENIGT